VVIVEKRQGVKVRIDGKDIKGAVTSRSILLADCTVEEVEQLIRRAVSRHIKGVTK